MMAIPVVNLADDPLRAARQIGEACAEIGFFQIVGHGVPDAVVDPAWWATRAFFDEPEAVRLAVAMPYPGYPYGYQGFAGETLAASGNDSSLGDLTPPDRKHSFSFGPIDALDLIEPNGRMATIDVAIDPDERWVRSPNQWPASPADFRDTLETYYRAMSALAAYLLQLMAMTLHLEPKYFEAMIDRHVSALRCLDYPALTEPPLPGQLRAGAHTDYGTLTILRTAPGVNGLQTRDRTDEWCDVDAIGGGFIVNLGDTLARWTNDRWRSTMHRVVETAAAPRRTSLAFFHNANWDARIECLPGLGQPLYAPVSAGRHLMEKFHRTVGG